MPEIIDATVADQPYDMSGNGGRKLVMLENGWLVAVLKASTTRIDFYVSKDNGETWNLLCYQDGAQSTDFPAIESYGTTIYFLVTRTGNRTSFATFDATLMNGENIYDLVNFIITESASQNNTLVVNGDGTELHAAWASRNSTYPNSFNIRYVKGTINDDGSVSWGVVEQVSTDNTSNVHTQNPSIVVNGLGYPIIICERYTNGAFYNIYSYYYNGSTWSYYEVYNGGVYNQSFPSAIFVPQSINGLPNGRLWVAWEGLDSTDTTYTNIKTSYSDDGGITWSNSIKLTNGNTYHQTGVSLTANKNNEIFAVFSGATTSNFYRNVRMVANIDGTWSNIQEFNTGITSVQNNTPDDRPNPTTVFDQKFNLSFSSPLFIYKNKQTARIGFYGTWAATNISVPQGDIGIKTDKNNLLSYNITTDVEMSEVVEKVNGVIVGRKTLSSGEETQVSLTEGQWNAVKFGKYSSLDKLNTLTIEMGENKWEYTFDKRLADDANIHEIVKATKEANEIVLPAKKAKIVEAINEIGGNANDEDTLEELADKIKQSNNVKYASGTVVSSSNDLHFQYTGSTSSRNMNYIEITNIPFIPRKIIIYLDQHPTKYITIYDEMDSAYPKTIKTSTWNTTAASAATYNFKADVGNAIVSKDLVRMPVNSGRNINGTWEAWG